MKSIDNNKTNIHLHQPGTDFPGPKNNILSSFYFSFIRVFLSLCTHILEEGGNKSDGI